MTKEQHAWASLPPDDRERFLKNSRDHAKIMGPQIANWIQDGVRVTHMVAGGSTDMIPVFWIRLYGVLADISDKVTSYLNFFASQGVSVRELHPVKEAIDNLAKVFTDDELIYIQYRRHVECHPLQEGYRLQLTKDGLKDSVFHRLPKQEQTVESTKEAICRVLEPFGFAEHLVAQALAGRAYLPLLNVLATSISWFGPPR